MPKHRRYRKDSDVDNTKGKDKFVNMPGMGAHAKGGVAPITNVLDTIWRWVISCKFGPLYSWAKTPRYVPKAVETREGLEVLYKENVICSCRDSNDDSLVTIPTSLSRLLREKYTAYYIEIIQNILFRALWYSPVCLLRNGEKDTTKSHPIGIMHLLLLVN